MLPKATEVGLSAQVLRHPEALMYSQHGTDARDMQVLEPCLICLCPLLSVISGAKDIEVLELLEIPLDSSAHLQSPCRHQGAWRLYIELVRPLYRKIRPQVDAALSRASSVLVRPHPLCVCSLFWGCQHAHLTYLALQRGTRIRKACGLLNCAFRSCRAYSNASIWQS